MNNFSLFPFLFKEKRLLKRGWKQGPRGLIIRTYMSFSLKYPRVIFTVLPYIIRIYPRLIRYSNHPEKYPLSKRYELVHEVGKRLTKGFRVDLKLLNPEIPEDLLKTGRPILVVSNHLSDYDPIILYTLFSKALSFVAKEETEHFIGVGRIVKASDGLFLPRKDLRASFFVMKKLEEGLRQEGRIYGIFPEGTRNRDLNKGLLLPFHAGSFKPAMKAGAVILPLSLYGTPRVLNQRPNDKRIPLEVSYGKPLFPEEYAGMGSEEVAKIMEERVLTGLKEIMELDRVYHELGFHKVPLKKGDLWKEVK